MATATVTSKGQITIPAAVRQKLRLQPGSKVDFIENPSGEIVIRPKTSDLRKLFGCIEHRGPALTIQEIDEVAKKAAAERFRRSAE